MIQNRLDNNNEPDDPLKGCWSCLWNVTDETPSNSERFIENGGVELFLKCLKKFPNDTDLKRNIMFPNQLILNLKIKIEKLKLKNFPAENSSESEFLGGESSPCWYSSSAILRAAESQLTPS